MAKTPDNRRPFDPAKAARDRAAELARKQAPEPKTLNDHLARRRHLVTPRVAKREEEEL